MASDFLDAGEQVGTVTQSTYSKYERWARVPTIHVGLAIGWALDISPERLGRYFGVYE